MTSVVFLVEDLNTLAYRKSFADCPFEEIVRIFANLLELVGVDARIASPPIYEQILQQVAEEGTTPLTIFDSLDPSSSLIAMNGLALCFDNTCVELMRRSGFKTLHMTLRSGLSEWPKLYQLCTRVA